MADSDYEALQKLVMGDMPQVFAPAVVDHAMNPRNVGSLDDADGFAAMHSDCGENMEIWLRIKDDRIADIRFWSDGCGATIACGSMVGELACGKTVTDALKIEKQDIIDAFKELPEGNVHCAVLAVKTLKKSVRNYLTRQKVPGKAT
ncbi:MAG: iron-sulfur cluster assembly scaffold protein [Dehalococcoidales bacterium]|nr:iron-sulfur cluster assembly scaffold protein [Dehalococcoidales bacterium]